MAAAIPPEDPYLCLWRAPHDAPLLLEDVRGGDGKVAASFGISHQRVGQILARVEGWLATHGDRPLAQRMRLRSNCRWDALWSRAIEGFDRSREDRALGKQRVARPTMCAPAAKHLPPPRPRLPVLSQHLATRPLIPLGLPDIITPPRAPRRHGYILRPAMDILVDYNNVLEAHRRRGVRYVTERVLSAIGPNHLGGRRRAMFRLYDGWYEFQSPSRTAQEVSADVQANTPHTATLSDGPASARIVVSVELAYSLRSDPTLHLWHTFRPKAPQSNFACKDPQQAGCQVSACPLQPTTAFITRQRCPTSGCPVTPADLLVRNEQKLVDTMIAADLFSLFLRTSPAVALVSSDDDHLPIIRMLVREGMTVFHVLTRPPHQSLSLYLTNLDRTKYIQLQM